MMSPHSLPSVSPPDRGLFYAQTADLYDLDGNRLPQNWIKYLPAGGAVIGFSKAEVERAWEATTNPSGKP